MQPRYLRLEVFNGVIINHLDENPNLIYAILRSQKTFQDLGTFTLARGLREIRRVQLAKEEQIRRQTGKGKPKGDIGDDESPDHEKARLLSSESRDALGLSAEVDLEARLPIDQPRPSPTRGNSVVRHGDDRSDPDQQLPSSTSAETAQSLSEKVRGKMPERQRSESIDMSSSLERVAAAGIGRNGFVPTQDWVSSWQQG